MQAPQANIDINLLKTATAHVQEALPDIPETAIILGSGLGYLADSLSNSSAIDTGSIPGYPASTVEGHKGRWVVGENRDGVRLLAVQGRIHGYEGHPHRVVTFPIHLLARCGVKNLLITNAAGAVNRFYSPGDFMVIEDHINLTFKNPLIGQNIPEEGPRFPDMAEPYSHELIELALSEGVALGLPIHRGVYCAVSGPSYETGAEIRMAARMGADAIGMSTVPEVIVAVYRKMRVLGISCISNMATGVSGDKLSHGEVTEVANRVQDQFIALIDQILKKI